MPERKLPPPIFQKFIEVYNDPGRTKAQSDTVGKQIEDYGHAYTRMKFRGNLDDERCDEVVQAGVNDWLAELRRDPQGNICATEEEARKLYERTLERHRKSTKRDLQRTYTYADPTSARPPEKLKVPEREEPIAKQEGPGKKRAITATKLHANPKPAPETRLANLHDDARLRSVLRRIETLVEPALNRLGDSYHDYLVHHYDLEQRGINLRNPLFHEPTSLDNLRHLHSRAVGRFQTEVQGLMEEEIEKQSKLGGADPVLQGAHEVVSQKLVREVLSVLFGKED